MTEMSADEFPYQYFVSYAHATGSGNIQIGTRKPVQTYDAVKEFHHTICRARNLPDGSVVVLNYQPLAGPQDVEFSTAERALRDIKSMVEQFDTPRDPGRVRAFVGDVGQVASRGLGEASRD